MLFCAILTRSRTYFIWPPHFVRPCGLLPSARVLPSSWAYLGSHIGCVAEIAINLLTHPTRRITMPRPEPQPPPPDEPVMPSIELPPIPGHDPSLEIPKELRTPIRQPELPGTPGAKGTGARSIAGLGVGFAMALDFVGSILAGSLLGYLFDRWQGTSPTGVLIGLGIGFVGAMIRIVRTSQKAERAERKRR